MPLLVLFLVVLPVLWSLLRLLGTLLRELLTNPVSAVLLLVAMIGFYCAIAFGMGLVVTLLGWGLSGTHSHSLLEHDNAVLIGMVVAGLVVGNLGYWGRRRWNDYLAARRWARMQRRADRLTSWRDPGV